MGSIEESSNADGVDLNDSSLEVLLLGRPEFDFILEFVGFDDIFRLGLTCDRLLQCCRSERVRLTEILKKASHFNDLDTVNEMLKRRVPAGMVIGSCWNGFMTPLTTAAARGNHSIVKALLTAGADVNWRDEQGTSALDFARCRLNNNGSMHVQRVSADDMRETIKLLRNAGAVR